MSPWSDISSRSLLYRLLSICDVTAALGIDKAMKEKLMLICFK